MAADLTLVDQTLLMDQLAEFTARYTRFLVKGENYVDMMYYEKVMGELQQEIHRRKRGAAKRNVRSSANEGIYVIHNARRD